MNDITNKADIKLLVDTFYEKVQQDQLLAPVFALRLRSSEWTLHLQRMYDFWNTVLFFERSYKGNPFAKHALLPVEKKHFERWLFLFTATVDQHFKGKQAEDVKQRVQKMATLFQTKIEHLAKQEKYKSIL